MRLNDVAVGREIGADPVRAPESLEKAFASVGHSGTVDGAARATGGPGDGVGGLTSGGGAPPLVERRENFGHAP